MHISTSERSTIGNLTSVSWKEMTTEGREEVEAAVYKGRTTTRDGKDLTCDESGQDRSNTPPSCPDEGRVKKRKKKK